MEGEFITYTAGSHKGAIWMFCFIFCRALFINYTVDKDRCSEQSLPYELFNAPTPLAEGPDLVDFKGT